MARKTTRSYAPSRAAAYAAMDLIHTPPETLKPTETVARVIKNEGNGHFLCRLPKEAMHLLGDADDASAAAAGAGTPDAAPAAPSALVLLELSKMFKGTVMVRQGLYVLVDLVDAPARCASGVRVLGDIVNVVAEQKHWRAKPYWPASFPPPAALPRGRADDSDDESTVGKMPPSDSEDGDGSS